MGWPTKSSRPSLIVAGVVIAGAGVWGAIHLIYRSDERQPTPSPRADASIDAPIDAAIDARSPQPALPDIVIVSEAIPAGFIVSKFGPWCLEANLDGFPMELRYFS